MATKRTTSIDSSAERPETNSSETPELIQSERVEVMKTYKLFIGGGFPRTESGRYVKLKDKQGRVRANMCRASRKDFRNAVVEARKAFKPWSGRSAYNRGQILYRIAEILEGRRAQFISEIELWGGLNAEQELNASIDRLIYYAGWADKYQQLFSTVNPVSSAHFSFSLLEPVGVVGVFAPQKSPLLGLVSLIAPIIAGGNTAVVLSSENYSTVAITLAEVLSTSDVPAGVVNLLTGLRSELLGHFSSHMDLNSLAVCDLSDENKKTAEELSCSNLKRFKSYPEALWFGDDFESPYFLLDFQETKTTWHPVGK